jgi:hypothetical protein
MSQKPFRDQQRRRENKGIDVLAKPHGPATLCGALRPVTDKIPSVPALKCNASDPFPSRSNSYPFSNCSCVHSLLPSGPQVTSTESSHLHLESSSSHTQIPETPNSHRSHGNVSPVVHRCGPRTDGFLNVQATTESAVSRSDIVSAAYRRRT